MVGPTSRRRRAPAALFGVLLVVAGTGLGLVAREPERADVASLQVAPPRVAGLAREIVAAPDAGLVALRRTDVRVPGPIVAMVITGFASAVAVARRRRRDGIRLGAGRLAPLRFAVALRAPPSRSALTPVFS